MKQYLCVVDVLAGQMAALEVEAEDAIDAEHQADAAARARFGQSCTVLEVVRTDGTHAAA
jgi:hypothetical protein